jgi:hypothetical protein
MTKDTQLIAIYCTVCEEYYSTLAVSAQRLSNNFCPKFTDEECIAIYLFGLAQQKFNVKAIYNYIKENYSDWFPSLPRYQNFNRRICNLSETFGLLAERLHGKSERTNFDGIIGLLDSLPIIVANNKRSGFAKAASEVCAKSYCASKGIYYYGIKLHYIGIHKSGSIPKEMLMSWITPASVNDLTTAKGKLQNIRNMDIFADKAYCDSVWRQDMLEHNNVLITTPVKLKKGQKEYDPYDKLYNKAVSSIRQPVEAFFKWLIDKTRIQSASTVRSTAGLLAFVFARLASSAFF